mgnify:CR=1 FL=1
MNVLAEDEIYDAFFTLKFNYVLGFSWIVMRYSDQIAWEVGQNIVCQPVTLCKLSGFNWQEETSVAVLDDGTFIFVVQDGLVCQVR